jgi:hypothetical protein
LAAPDALDLEQLGFLNKARWARVLGAIDAEMLESLRLLAKIRNGFAHAITRELEHEEVNRFVESLANRPRQLFLGGLTGGSSKTVQRVRQAITAVAYALHETALQMKAATKAVLRHGAVLAGRDHVYGKRLREDKKRIRIAMLTDNSGSMRMPVTSAIDANTIRIKLAARFVVSAITAIEHLPEVEVGVWTFDESILQVVQFGKHAATDTRKAIGKQMITTGASGTDAPLAIATLRQISALPARPNTQTFLVLITDGEWGYGPGAPAMVSAELQALLAAGVDLVDLAVLTIGCDTAEAKTFVGEERADEITDDTAADTIKDHIYRLLHPVT